MPLHHLDRPGNRHPALGLHALGIAGSIEGFVTGSGMPTWLRVGTGVVAFAAFAAYAVTAGRAAAARGLTGTLGEEPRQKATHS
ncbi:MAG: hypothetical protein ACRD0Q_00315 [Acidimicrobiales bacterium]